MTKITIHTGDILQIIETFPDNSIHCVITSPPYWGLRDYGVAGQIGLEPTIEEYVAKMVAVFREVRRVLRPDGTLWLNLGDSYAGSGGAGGDYNEGGLKAGQPKFPGKGSKGIRGGSPKHADYSCTDQPNRYPLPGLKAKDLCLVPQRVAKALQEPYYTGKIKSEADRIWLAAIIDGEGSIFLHRQPEGTITGRGRRSFRSQDNFCAGIAISNCSEALVQRAAQIFGNGSLQHTPMHGNRRDHYQSRITGNLAKNILREVYPYLVAKQQEARLCIGCPPSGDKATAHWVALKELHKKGVSTVDCAAPDPRELWEPGWYLRSDIIWAKPNPMPESCTDRPTKAHEHIFLLTKSAKYFYDAEAVREAQSQGTFDRYKPGEKIPTFNKMGGSDRKCQSFADATPVAILPNGRNLRSVWTIATSPFPEAHFATYPPELVRRCVAAGTSEKGCCPKCGAPWVRVVEKKGGTTGKSWHPHTDDLGKGMSTYSGCSGGFGNQKDADGQAYQVTTTGWRPTCTCDAGEPVPCVCLDPFGGSGTTGLVAAKMGRDAVLIELKPEYAAMAAQRIRKDLGMLAEIEIRESIIP